MTTSLTCSARTFPTANGSLSSLRFFSSYGTASQTQTSQTKAPEECHQEQNWWSGPWGRSLRLNRICPILFFCCNSIGSYPFPLILSSLECFLLWGWLGLLGRSWSIHRVSHVNPTACWAQAERCWQTATPVNYGLSWETSKTPNQWILG